MDDKIYSYITDRHNRKIGVIAAAQTDFDREQVCIGWALANRGAGDTFDRRVGLEIAIGRARKGTDDLPPPSIREYVTRMTERAKKYFKGKTITP